MQSNLTACRTDEKKFYLGASPIIQTDELKLEKISDQGGAGESR